MHATQIRAQDIKAKYTQIGLAVQNVHAKTTLYNAMIAVIEITADFCSIFAATID